MPAAGWARDVAGLAPLPGRRRGLAWILVAALAALACGGEERPRGRVLLVGLDGATLRVAEPLLRQGRLPHLARIAADGVHGPLRSFPPLFSPRIWTTIATGKVPEKHGILSFSFPRADGSTALYLGSDRKTHALWNITSRAGLVTAVVNWWTTFPPERIHGVMVSDHLLEIEVASRRQLFDVAAGPPAAPAAYPASWAAKARAIARQGAPAELPNPLARPPPRLPQDRARAFFEGDVAATRIALAIREEERPDLLMVFMSGIDRVSHLLWGAFESPERYARDGHAGSTREAESDRETLFEYYVHADRLVGLLAEGYGPDDLVIVVSDHGFEAENAVIDAVALTGGHTSHAASDGVLFARGPGIARGGRVEGTTVNDVTPTVLAWLGLPLGEDMDGAPAAFLERRPPAPVATHDTRPVERVPTDSRGAEGEILEQLRALGYLE